MNCYNKVHAGKDGREAENKHAERHRNHIRIGLDAVWRVECPACATCHSVDGSANTGPTWKGIYGTKHKLADGKEVVVDENYLRESMLDPNAKVVAGYQPVMPTYQGILKDKQIDALIAYIKSLK